MRSPAAVALAVACGSLAALAGLVAFPAPAAADPRAFASGWFAEGGLGAVAFLPKASSDAAVGPAINIRVGRDLFPWLSIGVSLAASNHEATVPPPPDGQWFQLYRTAADARLTARFDKIDIFAEGGAGLAMISSNILGKVMITDPGESRTIAFQAGAGAEYQLENRHYIAGLAIDAFLLPQFASIRGLDTRLYLRYTY